MKITKWDLIDGELSAGHHMITLRKTPNGNFALETEVEKLVLSKKDMKEMLMEAVFWIENV